MAVPSCWAQRYVVFALSVVGTASLVAGCGSRHGDLGMVSGRVTFQGEPVSQAVVVFSSAETGVHIQAEVDQDGRYEMHGIAAQGMPPGTYHVAVEPPPVDLPVGPIPKGFQMPKYPKIPAKYRSVDTSRLEYQIRSGDNQFDIVMQP